MKNFLSQKENEILKTEKKVSNTLEERYGEKNWKWSDYKQVDEMRCTEKEQKLTKINFTGIPKSGNEVK